MTTSIADALVLLNETILECLKAPSEQVIIKKMIHAAISVLGADFGYSFVKSAGDTNFHLIYRTTNTMYMPITTPRKRGIVAKAFHTKKPQLINDVTVDPNIRYDAKKAMRGVAVIPMTHKKSNYGVLILSYYEAHQFSAEEQTLCSFIGSAAAQAITINRLYSNLKDFKQTLDGTLDSIFMFDPKSLRVTYANEGALRLIGLTKAELFKKTFFDLQRTYTPLSMETVLESLTNGRQASELFETELICKDRSLLPAEFFIQYVVDKEKKGKVLSIVRDISERKRAEASIRHNAYHDTLTNLPNRIYFTEKFKHALERVKNEKGRLALLFVDLDRFKFINDVLGHVTGDLLLAEVAKRLMGCVEQDDIISRMGGDEFVMLLSSVESDQIVTSVAEKLLKAFAEPFHIDGQEVFVNISIGISMYPFDGTDAISLLKNADSALQRAKEHGGSNYQQYHSGIVAPGKVHMELEQQLRKAIENEELVIHYQPQIDLATGKISGCEALIRWQHPKLGLIYPDQFIGYAEDSGLIIPIGEWVLRKACAQVVEWNSTGFPQLTLAVNLSPRQLLQQNLVTTVSKILNESGLPPQQLELEITERLIMKNIDISIEILKQLKSMGIKLSVDDFGTGYASLSYLRRLPVDMLKIDRSFIHGSLENIQDAAIITAIITIAHQIGLKVMAEGVETEKQLEFLSNQACDYVQGNLFSPSLSSGSFADQFRSSHSAILPKQAKKL